MVVSIPFLLVLDTKPQGNPSEEGCSHTSQLTTAFSQHQCCLHAGPQMSKYAGPE